MFARPNGSGKSSVTPLFQNQADFPKNYIDPDEIVLTLGGNTMKKAYEASAIVAGKVERIAPILLDYLKLNQDTQLESDRSVIMFDKEKQILIYQDKLDSNEQLKAQYKNSRWLNLGSKVSR